MYAEYDLLRGTAAYQRPQLGDQLVSSLQIFFLFGHLHGVAQRTGGVGDNGDLGDRLGVFFQGSDQRVAHFVICYKTLFGVREHRVLFLCAGDDHFKGDQQVLLIDRFPALTDCPQGSFIDQIGQIRAHRTGCCLGDLFQIHILRQLDLPGMDLEGVQTALEIGAVHDDAAVKTAGTQQRLVQNFRTVGSGEAYDALGGVEAVDLTQKLVQGLLLLGVAAEFVVPGTAYRVDLVNEYDTGCYLGSLLEQITDTAGTHAHEHFHKVRAGNGEEGDICLTGNCLGKQGLTSTGGAYQQRALGQLGTDICILFGVVQKVDDFLQGFLGLILTGNVLEGHTGLLFHIDLGLAGTHAAHHAITAEALGNGADQHEEDGEGDHIVQDHHDHGIVFRNHLVDPHAHGIQFFRQFHHIAGGQAGHTGLLLGGGQSGGFLGQVKHPVILKFHFRQIPGFHGGQEIRVSSLGIVAAVDRLEQAAQDQNDGHGNNDGGPDITLGAFSAVLGRVIFLIAILFHIKAP